ncbi:hypothetical protein A5633_25765 [Mycolicibacterium elephantis]|nr:hypothetical protein A5633_25765 [Mycolicibacterium elephantis]
MECSACQGILISTPVELLSHQLLRRSVGDRTDGHVSRCETLHLVCWFCDAKVGQQNSTLAHARIGKQNVRRFDISVKQIPLVRVVECASDGSDNLHRVGRWHSMSIALPHKPSSIVALDEIHCDPELTLVLASIVDGDDVGVPQGGSNIGLTREPLTKFRIGAHILRKNLERFQTRQPRMFCEVHLAHSPCTQQADDAVASKLRSIS